jgi:uncharacterized protein YjiK
VNGQGKYQFSNPCAYYTLPDTLYEISGLTDVDSAHIGCVQDEKGMIFLYNLYEAKIDSRSTFYFDGDYEGITRVENDMFVLRSDGYLFRMKDYMMGKVIVKDSFATQIPINNNEGLCYDEKNNVLLIAAKGRIKKSKDTRDLRFIYGFRIDSLSMIDTAIFVIDIDDIASKMKENGINVPYTVKKNGDLKYENLKFMPSSIAVHPLSDGLYILSAVDRLLVILNRSGLIESVVELPPLLFPKPEGITFLPNGDMLISNEGNGGKANLMRFCY